MNSKCGLLGKKIGMTQVFEPDGSRIGVTAIEVGPCVVVQKKTEATDGYSAVKLGFLDQKEHRVNRPMAGVFKKAGVSPKKVVREFRVSPDEVDGFEVGQELTADVFSVGDKVDVQGLSKGKGFTGVMKAHGFRGTKATHGVHEYFRHGGSIGMCMTPGRVLKGHRMAGHHSHKTVTVQNLTVVRVFPQDNLIFVKGPVPGSRNTVLKVRPAIKG